MIDVDIVNMALDQVGGRLSVTSVFPSDGTVAGNVAARNYQPRIDALSRAAHWNCLRYEAGLTLLKAAAGTPENLAGTLPVAPRGWAYEYALPAVPRCLKVRFVFSGPPPASSTTTIPLTGGGNFWPSWCGQRYEAFTPSSSMDQNGAQIRTILTNARYAIAVYTARVTDPDLWDAQFVEAAVATLAAWFTEPLSGDTKDLQVRVMLAKELVMGARVTDGNEEPVSVNSVPDWIAARSAGSRMGAWGAASVGIVPWDAMALPGGQMF